MANRTTGFTGRIAAFSVRRPWLMVLAWIALLFAGLGISAVYPADLTTDMNFTNSPEAVRGDRMIIERMERQGPTPHELVIVRSSELTVEAPEFQSFVGELQGQLMALDGYVEMAASYYQIGDESLVSDDRMATVIPVSLTASDVDVHPFLDVLDAADGQQGFEVVTGGFPTINNTFIETAERDLLTGETIGVSMALIVLVVVFGTLVAAGVPLIMAVFGILISVGVTMIIGHQFDLSVFVLNMMIMIGLAVGIDYSLFILGRYREERQKGFGKVQAITRSADTASKAVFFSGVTVVIALTGMLIVPSTLFKSLGAGAIIVVIVSVIATLTLLPAVLSLLGDRVNRGRNRVLTGAITVALLLFALAFRALDVGTYFIAFYIGLAVIGAILTILGIDPFHRTKADNESGQFWARISRVVMRRPVISMLTVGLMLIGLSAVYFTIEIGESGIDTLPQDSSSYRAFAMIRDDFSALSLESPNMVVIDAANVNSADIQTGIEQLSTTLAADPDFGPPQVRINEAGDLVVISTAALDATGSSRSIRSIERLRSEYVPHAFGGTNAEVLVTGPSAYTVDFNHLVSSYTPIVFAFVLGMSFLLLLLAFRSLVVPLKSVLMNLLSVGAAYGLLVAVFQHGVGNEIFGFQQVERIDAWVPLMMFTILFGLSMDYHVFLLSRVRERYDATRDNTESVAFGVRTTSAMITGAALVMVAVFSGFAMGDLVMFQQIGFGLAVAVILDATIVRSVLVPASMRLLGDWNWYLPRWLAWLPEINVEGEHEKPVIPQLEPHPKPAPSPGQS
jgi:putative drug exporter of the RND superfamily